MTFSQRCYQWNVWYDSLPNEWRFQVVLWPLIVLGAINMLLTVSSGFPFGLLLLLGFLCLAAVRVPHKLGPGRLTADGTTAAVDSASPPFQISGMSWAIDWNRRYDAMPELSRMCVFPAILVVAGMINMVLTIDNGFPFGLLFVLALVAVVAIRVPYIRGWIKSSDPVGATGPIASPHTGIPHTPATAAIAASGEPAGTDVSAPGAAAGAEFPMPVIEQPDRVARPAFAPPPAVAATPSMAAPAETGAPGIAEAPSRAGVPPHDVDAPPHPGPAPHDATASNVAPPDTSASS